MWTLRLLGFVVAAEDVTCVSTFPTQHISVATLSRGSGAAYTSISLTALAREFFFMTFGADHKSKAIVVVILLRRIRIAIL